jgi:isoquinoline 1-oxidoreductase alpha subunit
MATYRFSVNGTPAVVDVDAEMPLLWVLRDILGLTGTKYGCGIAQCGACTVHVNGEAIRSCSMAVGDCQGKAITTIEGLASRHDHPLQKTWIEHDVPQCGYCQSGMLMTAAAALPKGIVAAADALGEHICRCGTYNRISAAVETASKSVGGKR